LASIFIIKPMKASAMINVAMRIRFFAAAIVAVVALAASPLQAASKNPSGDGSGIGGTGNSPSGGGIGGTGTKEQNSPKSMPDIPDRPEAVETPDIEPPELPNIDNDSSGMSPPPTDSLPEPPQNLPSAR
jgi:hypothetical protein